MTEPDFCRFVQLFDRVVDLQQGVITGEGDEVRLGTKELRLLEYLVRAAGPVSRDDLLQHVWGVSAQVDTRTIETTVRRLRTKIEADPTTPRHLITEHGTGYRFVSVEVPKAELPRLPPQGLIGREHEFEEVCRKLSAGRLVTLVGLGGAGKTRLATEILRSVQGRTEFFDLASCRGRADLLTRVAEYLGVSIHQEESASIQCLGRAFRAMGRAVAVFDNFEQLTGKCSDILNSWREMAPDLAMIVTSRERVGLTGEWVFEVGPLSLPASIRLFRERAVAAGATPDSLKESDIASICQRLDGLPLAIELAAARARVLGTARLADPTQGLLGLLTRRFRDTPDRQATLRGALDWSWSLLSADEQRGLALSSLFSGGFTAEALTAIAGDPGIQFILEELVDKSLVRILAPETEEVRFGLYFCVREYAQEKWSADPDPAQELRFVEHFSKVARRSLEGLDGPGDLAALKCLHRERLNLEEAFERAVRIDPPSAGWIGSGLLRWARHVSSWHRQTARILEVLEQHPHWPGEVRARLQVSLLFKLEGAFPFYVKTATEARDAALAAGEREVAILAAATLGAVLGGTAEFEQALAILRGAVSDAERAGSPLLMTCRILLARVLMYAGEPAEALSVVDAAIAETRVRGAQSVRANAHSLRGRILAEQGQGPAAIREYEEAEQILVRFPGTFDRANVCTFMADALLDGFTTSPGPYPEGVESWRLSSQILERAAEYAVRMGQLFIQNGASEQQFVLLEAGRLECEICDGVDPDRFRCMNRLFEILADPAMAGVRAVPLSILVRAYWLQHRPQEALALYHSVMAQEGEPDFRWFAYEGTILLQLTLAGCYAQLGRAAEADDWLERVQPTKEALRRAKKLMQALVGVELGRPGAVAAAQECLEALAPAIGTSRHIRRLAMVLASRINEV